jgi:hypothetical protein
LNGLASGTYYCVFEAADNSGSHVKSSRSVLLLLK